MVEDRTTIQVSSEVWRWLNSKKEPGESFDAVIKRELGIDNDSEDVEADGSGEETYQAGDTVLDDSS